MGGRSDRNRYVCDRIQEKKSIMQKKIIQILVHGYYIYFLSLNY